MRVDFKTPEYKNYFVRLNGRVVGSLLVADSDRNFVIQSVYENGVYKGTVTKHGHVEIIKGEL
jgi:hypothetical protein